MELGIPYILTGPDGTRVVFGNSAVAKADPDWVGWLDPENGITGLLDGADVRESADDIPEGDSGVHGDFYLSRRAGTIQGVIDPNVEIATVMQREGRIRRASRALRDDATLRWTPSGDSIERMLRLRRQGRPAFPGRRPKQFQLGMVSADAYVEASSESSVQVTPGQVSGELGFGSPLTSPLTSTFGVAGAVIAVNQGDAPATPRFRIDGPITNPRLRNNTTGEELQLVYTLAAGEYLVIDAKVHTIKLNGTSDRYSALSFTTSTWWDLEPGANEVRLLAASYSTGALLTVTWRHTFE